MHLSVLCLLATVASDSVLSGPAWTAEGNQHGAWFGASVACAGDVNGDGFSDVIVGAPTYDNGETGEGRAFVYLGAEGGLEPTPAWTAESNQPFAEFGNSVATAGDVNGDGYSDVIVAAWLYSNGESNEGRVFVYLGSSAGLGATPAWTAESDQAHAAFGNSVATAGDVNGDGFSDVTVGAWQHDGGESNEGRAFVYLGSSSGLAASPAWTAESDQLDARFGSSVAAAGDVDGDGFDDVLVGADQYDGGEIAEGRAFLYRGSPFGLAASAAWTTESNQAGAHLGLSVATAGDVNGDGFADAIVGAIFYSNGEMTEGRALVFAGSSSGLSAIPSWTAESNRDFTSFGSTVATAGDVNGDGFSDVIVAANGYEDGLLNEGAAFVYLGSSAGLAADPAWSAEGEQFAARFGWSAAAAGDVNADGYTDVIIGANLYHDGQPSEGRAFLYAGSSSMPAARPSWFAASESPFGGFRSFGPAGDVDGDGYGDVIVAEFAYDNFRGRALVYTGSSTGLSPTFAWSAQGGIAEAQFGFDIGTAGDVNGDGYNDVIVGAPRWGGAPLEGLALVYHGSSAGLSFAAAWSGRSNHAGAQYGTSVAPAGDVNGDGYGDVIIGAPFLGSEPRGRVYVYHGSQIGLGDAASWTADGAPEQRWLGRTVASAGDVNADGYSDVIVGGELYGIGGRAHVYLGSSVGLATSAAWTAKCDWVDLLQGYAITTAGDVNGDGYSDVIVGRAWHTDGEQNEGSALVYLGSSAGLSTDASWTVESNLVAGYLGSVLASAGDVNADGYSDVIASVSDSSMNVIRALVYTGSSTGLSMSPSWTASGGTNDWVAPAGDVNGDGFGDVLVPYPQTRVGLHLGNRGRGWTLAPQQRQARGVEPIQSLGRSRDNREFRLHLALARTLAGFDWASGATPLAKLEWQIEPLSSPLAGSPLRSGIGVEAIDGSLIRFNEIVSFDDFVAPPPSGIGHHIAAVSRPYHWRARIRTSNPLFPVTPWVSIPGSNVTETKLRAGPVRQRH